MVYVHQSINKIKNQIAHTKSNIFEFDSWNSSLPEKIFINLMPEIRFFQCIGINNYELVIQFYKTYKKFNYEVFIESLQTSKIKIPTFQRANILNNIIQFVQMLSWKHLSKQIKIAVWQLLCGFSDGFDNYSDIRHHICKNSNCENFLQSEMKLGRILMLENTPFTKFTACEYFCIQEEKIKPCGEKYVKERFVCNLKPANSQIKKDFLASNLQYDFKTAETLFTDRQKFEFLTKAEFFTLVDKKDFYHQIIVNPTFTSVIFSKQKFYLDLRAKQGHLFSSAYAQMLTNLLDYFFNFKKTEKMASLQDDSLIFHFTGSKLTLEKITSFNKKFGFELNHLKTVFRSSNVTWSGYNFDSVSKSIAIPNEKFEKLKELGLSLLSQSNSRRVYAKFLGKIYSYRLVAAGLRANFSILTFRIRKHMFKNTCGFYDQLKHLTHFTKEYLDKYSDFFNEIILPDKNYLENQVNFLLDIFSRRVSFYDVRNHIFSNNFVNLQNKLAYLFVDASLEGFGFIMYKNNQKFAISCKFTTDCRVIACASINFKELYAIFIALNFCIQLDCSENNISDYLIFTDNESAKFISYTKKANLRSDNLLHLAEAINYVQMLYKTNFYFDRISTSENIIADFASRNFENSNLNFSALMGTVTFQYIIDNFCNQPYLNF